jgi:hypothetical protein
MQLNYQCFSCHFTARATNPLWPLFMMRRFWQELVTGWHLGGLTHIGQLEILADERQIHLC